MNYKISFSYHSGQPYRKFTVPTFTSCTKCVGSLDIIHNHTPIVTQIPGHGCMDDLRTDRSYDWVNGVIGVLSMGVSTLRHLQTSGRRVQELNAFTLVVCRCIHLNNDTINAYHMF